MAEMEEHKVIIYKNTKEMRQKYTFNFGLIVYAHNTTTNLLPS